MEEKGLDRWDLLALGIILTIGIVVWFMPISNLPFGDVDASTHFTLGYFMSQSNTIISNLPYYINFTYGFANDGKLWYPPQFHLNEAIIQIITNQDIIPVYIFYLFCALAIIPTSYLLVKYLFGRWPAIMVGILLLASKRDFLTYLWGLWPEKISFAFVPLILYFFYRYYEKKELKYLIFTSLLAGSQFLLHPQGFIHSVVILGIFAIFLWIKNKTFPIKIKHLILSILILALLILPFLSSMLGFNKNVMEESYGNSLRIQQLGTLFKWYPEIPYTPQFGDFKYVYQTWFLLPFILLGVIFCLIKRKEQHFLLLSYLVGLYVLMHLNVIGISGRVHRSLNAEAQLFYILAVLGFIWVFSVIHSKKLVAYAVPVSIFLLYFLFSFAPIVSNAENAYQGIGRPNEYQYKMCIWVKDNTPQDKDFLLIGTLNYVNRKWIQGLCLRHIIFDDKTIDASQSPELGMQDYVILDLSEAYLAGQDKLFAALLNASQKPKAIYSNDFVEVYKLG